MKATSTISLIVVVLALLGVGTADAAGLPAVLDGLAAFIEA